MGGERLGCSGAQVVVTPHLLATVRTLRSLSRLAASATAHCLPLREKCRSALRASPVFPSARRAVRLLPAARTLRSLSRLTCSRRPASLRLGLVLWPSAMSLALAAVHPGCSRRFGRSDSRSTAKKALDPGGDEYSYNGRGRRKTTPPSVHIIVTLRRLRNGQLLNPTRKMPLADCQPVFSSTLYKFRKTNQRFVSSLMRVSLLSCSARLHASAYFRMPSLAMIAR